MSQNEKKPWERPWTTQEMIDNASNWSLAGDSGLLKYLEDFSEKMLSKVKDTNDRLNDLIDSADETCLALNNATNQFMGLKNTQFIESRVYEDDETLPTKPEPEKEEPPKHTEADKLEEMKNAIFNGLEIIDKYYEKVEIPESDSEEDTDEPSILYRPVDPYIDRPLPYVIGTAEWYKYWHVGLAHSSSDSEVENDQDQFSETESEPEMHNLPERDRSQIPGVSDSESDELPKNKMSKPVANSTFNDNTNKNMFDSSSESETGSLPPQVNTVNSNFAEELAAKLGKVESSVIKPEINTKPIKKQQSTIPGGLFSDEPPPLEDDMFINKNLNSGLFSGGDGLFDDVDDDNDFWNTKGTTSAKAAPVVSAPVVPVSKPKDDLFSEEHNEEDIFTNSTKKLEENITKTVSAPTKKPSGLFDDDDDDLFSTPSFTQSTKSLFPPSSKAAPLISEEPPELEPSVPKSAASEEIKRKKPVGGISVLGPNALLSQQIGKILKNRAPSSSDSETDQEPSNSPSKSALPTQPPALDISKPLETVKTSSIFDDTSPLFSDDIFSGNTTKKFTSSLFDSEPPALDDELFKPSEISKPNQKETITTDKPKNEPVVSAKPDLFSSEPPPISPTTKKTLFENDESQDDLFASKSTLATKSVDNNLPSTSESVKKSVKTSSLFDDDIEDDLFLSINKPKSHDLFDSIPPPLNNDSSSDTSRKVDLFDPNPPELDETDARSECHSQLSLENDSMTYGSMSAGRASLFDTEPPLLSNESSGIVKDQSTRLESEDNSFLPCMTSSRRHSDLFQEHQTSDSLLNARNKLSLGTDSNLFSKSDLCQIPEQETVTKIDITPSGNESSLINESSANNSVFSNVSITKNVPKSEEINTEQPKKPISLFNDEDDLFKNLKPQEKPKSKNVSLFSESDSDDDLFSSSGTKNSSASDILNNTSAKPVKQIKSKNIFEDELFSGPNLGGIPDVDLFSKDTKQINNTSENKVKSFDTNKNDDTKDKKIVDDFSNEEKSRNDENDSKKFNYDKNLKSDEVIKTDPKKSLSFEKNVSPEIPKTDKEEIDGQVLSATTSPGKLRHSLLNINVAALLPGAAPPRRQNLEKSASLDSSESNQNVPSAEEVTKSEEKLVKESRPPIEKSISFDCPVETNEILTSAAKERVRIPVKRRPSTRRARQEAIRKSAIDLNIDDSLLETNSPAHEDSESQNILNIANNNITNETSNSMQSEKNVNIEENKIKNPLLNPLSPSTDEEDFFSMPREKDLSENFEENSLFGKAPVLSPVDVEINKQENKRNIEKDENIKPLEDKMQQSDDLFDKPDLFTSDSKTKTDIFNSSLETKTKIRLADTSIFSSSDSENDIFSSLKTEVKKQLPKNVLDNNNESIFSDEDLFKPIGSTASISSKNQSKILPREDSLYEEEDIFSSKKIPPKSTIIKKSLFDDDEDDNDDDIFGGSTSIASKSNSSSVTSQSRSSIKKPVTTRVKKLSADSVENTEDPLDALSRFPTRTATTDDPLDALKN